MAGPITISLSSSITSFSGAMIERSILKELRDVHSHWDMELNAADPGTERTKNISSARSLLFTSFHPPSLALLESLKRRKKWQWNFCLYGNFTEMASYWMSASEILRGEEVKFYALSSAHSKFVNQFMRRGEVGVLRPARISDIAFTPHLRKTVRKRLHLQDHEKMFLYTGRFSLQKQIHFLIDAFAEYFDQHRSGKLVLAGNFDDLGDSFSGRHYLYGHYEQYLLRRLSHLPTAVRKRIVFVPFQDPTSLSGLYSAADSFITLSTHHDDDYGVSVREALETGLPVICTHWGGHQDIPADRNFLVDVIPGLHRRAPDLNQTIQAMANVSSGERLQMVRTNPVLDLNEEPEVFTGMNERFSCLSSLVEKNPRAIFKGEEHFYDEIYRPYWVKQA